MIQNGPKGLSEFKNSAVYTYNHTCNQGQKSLDRLFLNFIYPFTALKLSVCLVVCEMGSLSQTLVSEMEFPLTFPASMFSKVRASTVWINTENGERGKSLINTPEWSNTFGPDCGPNKAQI